MKIKFKRLSEEAKLPLKVRPGDAAWDLYASERVWLGNNHAILVSTGLQLADMTPEDDFGKYHLEIGGRSGLAIQGIFPVGGIIDANYRGEIAIILFNGSSAGFGRYIDPGERIAQLLVRVSPKEVLIEESTDVTETDRGSNGFGSSGIY